MSISNNKYDNHIDVVNGIFIIILSLFNDDFYKYKLLFISFIIFVTIFIIYSATKIKSSKITINNDLLIVQGKHYDIAEIKEYKIGFFRSYIRTTSNEFQINFGIITKGSIKVLKNEFEKRINRNIPIKS